MDNTTDPTGDDINEATSSLPVPVTSASEAQLRANRANALRSTGPRTPAGKNRSAANSLKHGIYATRVAAIVAGPYSEDPDQVAAEMQAIIDALGPRDALEGHVASQIALGFRSLRRLAAWEDGLLADDYLLNQHDQVMAIADRADNVVRALRSWNHARSKNAEASPEVPWLDMGRFVQRSLSSAKAKATATWLDGATEADWPQRFAALIDHHFDNSQAFDSWLTECDIWIRAAAREFDSSSRAEVALESISVVERNTALRARLTNEVGKNFLLYEALKARPLAA